MSPTARAVVADEKPRLWIVVQCLCDALSWCVAIILGLVLRYELTVDTIDWSGFAVFASLAVTAQMIIGWLAGLYRGKHPFGSFEELRLLVVVTGAVTALLVTTSLFFGLALGIPRSSGIIAFPFACLFMASVRYLKRMYVEGKARPAAPVRRALVVGAGFLGTGMVNQMMHDPAGQFQVVGMVDDDPHKKYLRVASVPVVGSTRDLGALVEKHRADVVVVAVAQADPAMLRRLNEQLRDTGARLLRMPRLSELLHPEDNALADQLTEVRLEDLLGRTPVDLDVPSLRSYIEGRRVLVTGAGGSIGSEICRQVAELGPDELILLERDESAMQATSLSLTGTGLLTGSETVLADIRDAQALEEIFTSRRPEVVFHAAALKHVPLLEQYPLEAWKTNVLGTANVLIASINTGVETFVNISTDKAADPSTALGHAKRLGERLTSWAAGVSNARYVSVRFGNVIGSRGSVLPLFTQQIERGGPVTVTDPNVERYFMTIPEATALVLQAGAVGRGGEVLILDMGQPVKIIDVARQLIALSGRDTEIVITGLRPGEKMTEALVREDEEVCSPFHPLIAHTAVPPLAPGELDLDLFRQGRASRPATEALRVARRITPES
ncbi:nucleoside-diphosphate sugar epimerase/dehydratase [Falsarthrobacter nasiphocae]|uniref:FlaA1/EpsC-like NDP-sugar epimerase n=1 Tax=Falsarthrobacter nasiphocae TaxID=189863 RepID=A0AAE3YGH6_9MICC|nr:nucleoside-diphosphate sugar epimerase/dehydratase [Falsarthrobacter nasiphocae]MDR6892770.1 FlaA1/EpsC-like NDP-sugar epimerase [Falsarthrobacter nasiphocae]